LAAPTEHSTARFKGSLGWGNRVLMCSPEHFDVKYSINVWMDPDTTVDLERAQDQWQNLVRTLEQAGTKVELVSACPGLPDLVFTANAGVPDSGCFVPARMANAERAPETDHVSEWMAGQNWTVTSPPRAAQEGLGDALPYGGGLVGGYGPRSTRKAYDDLAHRLDCAVTALELVDSRFYHIDLAFCPLDQRTALVAPEAFTQAGSAALATQVPDPITVTEQEAEMFIANSFVVEDLVVMPACTSRLGREIADRGFDIVICEVSEFTKAGGGVRCLTLPLDVDLAAFAA
jgi:N-dimethylarginine dimethylaminohydrolase